MYVDPRSMARFHQIFQEPRSFSADCDMPQSDIPADMFHSCPAVSNLAPSTGDSAAPRLAYDFKV